MKTLHLTLKKKWFKMILSGEKKEEYRVIKDYWARRLLRLSHEMEYEEWDEILTDMKNPFERYRSLVALMNYFGVKFNDFKIIHFKNGYKKDSPAFYAEIKNIKIKQGKEEWGAEKGKYYFTFVLGEIVKI